MTVDGKTLLSRYMTVDEKLLFSSDMTFDEKLLFCIFLFGIFGLLKTNSIVFANKYL